MLPHFTDGIYMSLQIFRGVAAFLSMVFLLFGGNGAAHHNTCPATDGFVVSGLGIRNKVRSTEILRLTSE